MLKILGLRIFSEKEYSDDQKKIQTLKKDLKNLGDSHDELEKLNMQNVLDLGKAKKDLKQKDAENIRLNQERDSFEEELKKSNNKNSELTAEKNNLELSLSSIKSHLQRVALSNKKRIISYNKQKNIIDDIKKILEELSKYDIDNIDDSILESDLGKLLLHRFQESNEHLKKEITNLKISNGLYKTASNKKRKEYMKKYREERKVKNKLKDAGNSFTQGVSKALSEHQVPQEQNSKTAEALKFERLKIDGKKYRGFRK